MQVKRLILWVGGIFLVITGCSDTSQEESSKPVARDPNWAVAVEMEGVPNLHKVSAQLYRSAQPTATGMKNLKTMGVKTILNLRSFHSDRDEIKDLDLGYEHLTMKAWHPEKKEVAAFLRIVSDPNKLPVLVHCQHGADRTGTLCAIYRIVVQGWSKEKAIQEMTDGDYGFHRVWKNLPVWIENLDTEKMQRLYHERQPRIEER